MFYNYRIENNILYLYVDDKCEIGNFFGKGKDSLIDKVKDYIKKRKINFNGTKVVLLLSGLILGTVYLNNDFNAKSYNVYKGDEYVNSLIFQDKALENSLNQKIDNTVSEIVDNAINNNAVTNETKENNSVIGSKSKTIETKNNNVITSNNANTTNNKTSTNVSTSSQQVSNISQNNATISENQSKTSSVTTTKEQTKQNINLTDTQNEKMISVKMSNGEVINISLEEYLIGVVGAEMPASFNSEALKAQAIASRTYTIKLLEQNRTITDNISTQGYKTNSQLQSMWGASYNTYYSKVKSAVDATKGLYMTYNGNIIDAVYHSTSNGYTEDSINVWGNSIPYLKSVTSPWDTSASSFLRTTDISFFDLSNKLGFDFNKSTLIQIISRDESNRITKIKIGDSEYSGVELRTLLGLRSADFDITINDGSATFTTRGYGHGVGMSQYGANGMANSGYKYDEILKHYYTGISIVK